MKKWLFILWVFFSATFAYNSNVYPANEEASSLKGIEEMSVVIEAFPPEVEKEGVNRNHLQTDVELKLRLAGIKVIPLAPPSPFLYVQGTGMWIEQTGIFLFSLRISLRQKVLLARAPQMWMIAPTWENSASMWIGKDYPGGVPGVIRNTIKDRTEVFINDYLSVNPKGGK